MFPRPVSMVVKFAVWFSFFFIMYVCMYVCMYLCICMYVYMYVCMYVCVCMYHVYVCVCMYVCVYVGFKTLFYAVRHLDSTASYLPTGFHLGFFRPWPSLYNFHLVFLRSSRALFCFAIHFNAILGNLPSHILWTWPYHVSWFCSISFIIDSPNPILLSYSYISNSFFSWYSRGSPQGIHLCSFDPSFIFFCESPCFGPIQ